MLILLNLFGYACKWGFNVRLICVMWNASLEKQSVAHTPNELGEQNVSLGIHLRRNHRTLSSSFKLQNIDRSIFRKQIRVTRANDMMLI